MTALYILMALCLSGKTLAQVHSLGSCPQIEVQPNFDPSKFLGRWYEQERYFAYYELQSRCNIFDFFPGKTTTINMISSYVSNSTEKARSFGAAVYTPRPNQPAKMLTEIPLSPVSGYNALWILGTDYHNYAVVYSCNNQDLINIKYAWILTRTRIPHKSVLAKIHRVVDKSGVNKSYFRKTNQENCKDSFFAR